MKILTFVGARPQFIKAAVVSRQLGNRARMEEVIVHTGQHYDRQLSGAFFEELDLPSVDYNLGVGSESHAVQTAHMLERAERVILNEDPDCVLVYGDTNSTVAGALAGAKIPVPVAHVEAGLRSFNRRMPEEVNRIVTDHVSELLFAPTEVAVENIVREGLDSRTVVQSGDVMLDAFLFYEERAREQSEILNELSLSPDGFVLATLHRAENTDSRGRLRAAMKGLFQVAEHLPVVLPLHPRTDEALSEIGLRREVDERIQAIEPVGYIDMIRLESAARVIATDSGGVQKEAYFAGVPCVTLRQETEWTELLEVGVNVLCPPTGASEVARAILEPPEFPSSTGQELYGDGTAGSRIVESLASCSQIP